MAEYKFKGWMGKDKESANGNLVETEYEPKTWEETDVDIKITHCGICGSDIHTLKSGWGPTMYPCVVGHEIIGTAVKVGSKVQHVKLGDRVGVGAQAGSCLNADCEECESGEENYCQRGFVGTYNGKYPDGSKSYGGYADYTRVPGHFVIQLSDIDLPSEILAPMMCGGVTVYSPLVRNGCGPGKKVGILGVGGLGHFGVMFAKALGAEKVVGISRRANKRDDVLKLGADQYIATADDKDWVAQNKGSLDLIISTINAPNMPLTDYFALLRPKGQFIQVGVPEEKMPGFWATDLIMKNCKMGGSVIGSPSEIRQMVELAVKKGVKSWVNPRPLKECNQAVLDFEAGIPRFRIVLVNEKHTSMPALD